MSALEGRAQLQIRRPLRWRLPNAPSIFVGRELECARLVDLIARAPVCIVWGLGGLGKTSVVSRVLHERYPERVANTLFVSLRSAVSGGPTDGPHVAPAAAPAATAAQPVAPHVAVDVLRALCAAEGIHAVDWSSLLADEQALVETALDLAEQGGYTIVVDDLQHADVASTEALLRAVNRYARTSRWVMTSRVDWALPELKGQRVQLGVLDDRSMAQLARVLDADLSESDVDGLVARAAGSPWRMRLAVGTDGSGDAGSDIFQGLAPEAIVLMHALLPVEVPLRRSLLEQALPDTPAEVWEALERRGIIELRGSGWRLHDMARVLLRELADADRVESFAGRMVVVLASADEPAAWLEALRLTLVRSELGPKRDAQALDLLTRHGAALLVAGYAPELWRLLEPLHERSLMRWRLRCGAELGTPDVLAQLREPPDPTPEERTIWGQVLFAMGRMQESAEVVSRALTAARVAHDVTATADAELMFLHAQTLADLSRKNEMLEMLRAISSGQTELQQRALVAKVYALMGVFEPALAGANRILPECASIPVNARMLVYLDILAVYLSLGRMYDADDVLRRIERDCGDVSMALYSTRYLLVLRTSVTTHLGQLVAAHGHLDHVLPFTGRSTVQRPILNSLRLWLRLAQGDLVGLEGQIDQTNSEFARGANEYFVQWGFVLESLYDRMRGRSEVPGPDDPPALTGAGGNLLRIYRLLHRVRHGGRPSDGDRAFLDGLFPEGYLWALGRLVPATVALVAGDLEEAVREATIAAHTLGRMGNHLYESEALELLADALVLARRYDELGLVAEQLAAQGASFPSRRLATIAELFTMVASGPSSPVVLERLALADAFAPTMSRRARALLGGAPLLDEVDRRVVAELQRKDRARVVTVVGRAAADADWATGWVLDGIGRRVWLSDGALVELADHPIQWACLEAIAHHGGSASRETIVPAIWPGETYDPLVHNNRLNPAIRKLRVALEHDPSHPRRVVTTDDGYGFGDVEPVRWLRPAP